MRKNDAQNAGDAKNVRIFMILPLFITDEMLYNKAGNVCVL